MSGHSLPKIGISSCLLGHKVRYDGALKAHANIISLVNSRFQAVPLCPETGAGLPTPRPPVQLVETPHGIRMIGVNDRTLDVTDLLERWINDMLPQISALDGLILKSRSPSCGVDSTSLYTDGKEAGVTGAGLFSRRVMQQFPDLPIIEEGAFDHPEVIEGFFERIRQYRCQLRQVE